VMRKITSTRIKQSKTIPTSLRNVFMTDSHESVALVKVRTYAFGPSDRPQYNLFRSKVLILGANTRYRAGVNPSLSITAQAERAASLWPNKGEDDLRPAQGEPYRRLDPIAPDHPVVPADAVGALRHIPFGPSERVSSAG